MATKKTFTPQNLQVVLAALLLLVVAGGAGLFYLGLELVRTSATEVNHTTEDAKASARQIEELQSLRAQINEGGSLIEKANQLLATNESYQPQVLTDLRAYAERSGIKIASTDFSTTTNPNKHIVTVKTQNPTSYSSLIKFLDSVESNVPKLQVVAIKLSHAKSGGADAVMVEDIKIEVTTR